MPCATIDTALMTFTGEPAMPGRVQIGGRFTAIVTIGIGALT